jgi:hypothetical protein
LAGLDLFFHYLKYSGLRLTKMPTLSYCFSLS